MSNETIKTPAALFESEMPGIPLFRRGKVRDVYDLDDKLLIVATDRISAYDVIMSRPIPGKGAILTELSQWWFQQVSSVSEHHLISTDPADYPERCRPYASMLANRSMLVEKTEPLPVECVARGYLAGSGRREYEATGKICGVELPSGLRAASPLPEPIYTPATKAEEGHDENISFDRTVEILGKDLATRLRVTTLALFAHASKIATDRGLILADTKFEFGRRNDGAIILIDEALTPDSSRYWLASEYAEGTEPVNFDKQYLRDWLETTNWDKAPPSPDLPDEVVEGTIQRYTEARDLLIHEGLQATEGPEKRADRR